MSIQPQGESIRKAVKWLSEERQADAAADAKEKQRLANLALEALLFAALLGRHGRVQRCWALGFFFVGLAAIGLPMKMISERGSSSRW